MSAESIEPPSAVAVVVPARDEAELLGACLASVRVALERALVRHRLAIVVADHCIDATAYALAGGAGVPPRRHSHVHAANLGVRADAYQLVGGFGPRRAGRGPRPGRPPGRRRAPDRVAGRAEGAHLCPVG